MGREVLFVCTGNTCRSPLAEALCKARLAERMFVWGAMFGFLMLLYAATEIIQTWKMAALSADLMFCCVVGGRSRLLHSR